MANDDWKSSCDTAGPTCALDMKHSFQILACLAFWDEQFIYLGSFCCSQNGFWISMPHENHA